MHQCEHTLLNFEISTNQIKSEPPYLALTALDTVEGHFKAIPQLAIT